jgi:hypothetical protein
MHAQCRRTIVMGSRVLEFIQKHPDPEPGMVIMTARLEQLLARAKETATVQREGIVRERTASQEKEDLCAQMREVAIPHLAEIGRAAAREEPELGKIFRFRPDASTLFAFRTAARSMANAAQEHRELLVKHGLSGSVLDEFVQLLDRLDEAVALGNEGRAAHIGATRELNSATVEIARAVRVMDGRVRQRFAQDEQSLGSWIGASRLPRTPQPGTDSQEGGTPEGGETRPAA